MVKRRKVYQKKSKKKKTRKRSRTFKRESSVVFGFWYWVLQKPDVMQEFLERGDARQKQELLITLEHYKMNDPEFFKRIEGKKWLTKFQKQM